MLAATAAMAVAACGSAGADDGDGIIGAGAYEAVLAEFLPEPPVDEDAERPIVYVAHLSDEPLSLDMQVAIIESLAGTHDVRFVDDARAAVDDADEDAPPRDDGLLLGIGTIPSSPPHTVRVEVYTGADQVEAHRLTLVERGSVWRVETSEPVDPEGLVGDE